MRRILPYASGDLAGLELSPWQAHDFAGRADDAAKLLASRGRAFTARASDGRVLIVGGVAAIDASYGHAWGFMSAQAGPHMRWVTTIVRRFIDEVAETHRRIELLARSDFPQALKWADKLGFVAEGTMRCAAPDGGDMVRFARVNPDWRHLEMAA